MMLKYASKLLPIWIVVLLLSLLSVTYAWFMVNYVVYVEGGQFSAIPAIDLTISDETRYGEEYNGEQPCYYEEYSLTLQVDTQGFEVPAIVTFGVSSFSYIDNLGNTITVDSTDLSSYFEVRIVGFSEVVEVPGVVPEYVTTDEDIYTGSSQTELATAFDSASSSNQLGDGTTDYNGTYSVSVIICYYIDANDDFDLSNIKYANGSYSLTLLVEASYANYSIGVDSL